MKSFIYISIDKYAKFIFGIFTFYLVSNSLGSTVFGEYSYYQAIVSIAAISCFGSIDSLIQRDVISGRLSYNNALFIGWTLKYVTSLVGFILALCFFDIKNSLGFILLLSVFILPLELSSFLMQARKNYKRIAIIRLLVSVTFFVCRLVVVSYSPTKINFAILYLLELLAFGALTTVSLIFFDRVCVRKPEKLISLLLKYSKEGIYLLISFAALVLYTKLDILFLEHYKGIEYVGDYSIAIRVLDASGLIAAVLGMLYSHNLINNYSMYKTKYFIVCFVFSVMFAMLGYFFLPTIIDLLFDESYKNSIQYISYTSLLVVPSVMMLATGKLLILSYKSSTALIRNLICLLLAVVLDFIMIPTYGVYGAIISTGLVFISSTVFALYSLKGNNYA